MNSREEKLESLGYEIDQAPKPAGIYKPIMIDGKTFYMSGMLPVSGGELAYKGSIPKDLSKEEGMKAAELAAANLLRVFYRDVGSLNKIDTLIKVGGFVNSSADFEEPQAVVNGASKLLIDVLGEAGNHARAAVGMASLPLGAAVEVEIIGRLV